MLSITKMSFIFIYDMRRIWAITSGHLGPIQRRRCIGSDGGGWSPRFGALGSARTWRPGGGCLLSHFQEHNFEQYPKTTQVWNL